jgi:predicted transcriptional regulator
MKKNSLNELMSVGVTMVVIKLIKNIGTVKFEILELLSEKSYNIKEISNKTGNSYITTQRHIYDLMDKKLIVLKKYTDGKKYLKTDKKEYLKYKNKIFKEII